MRSDTGTVDMKADAALEASVGSARRALLDMRQPDGHWVFELEADCTIPAEYVLLRHFLNEPVDAVPEGKIASAGSKARMAAGPWSMTTPLT